MKNLNVLIIEDETIIALALMEKVKKLGTNVIDYVASFEEAYDALEQHPNINLLLVDINLNDNLNGIDLVDSLSKPLEVIYITAYDDTQNIQKAIKTNPLGYLLKPVNEKELYALLQLCREKYKRNNESMKEIKLPQGYVFNPKEDELSYQGQEIKLRGKQLELFKLLIQVQGKYIPFEVVEHKLYAYCTVGESTIRTLIYRLRSHFHVDIIETERSKGIRLKEV